jgi:hypothetical protein
VLLIHLHIPRNAGTTLGRMLRLKLGTWPPGRLLGHREVLGLYGRGDWEQRLAKIEALPPRRLRRVRLFEGHFGWGVHERLPGPSMYLTMLREPVDRALSVYDHLVQAGHLSPEVTLEEFSGRGVDPQRVWWIDNAQVRYLAGEGGRIVDVPRGRCTAAMLETASARLRADNVLFGLTDRFDASMVLLRRALRWRSCHPVAANAAAGRRAAGQGDPAIVLRLAGLNELDAELHRRASALFEERLAAGGPDVAREVARYPAANRRYALWMGPVQRALARG